MPNKIILSLLTASYLVNPLQAQTMIERFEAMENEMKALKVEIAQLKIENTSPMLLADNINEDDEDHEDEEEEDEDAEDFDIEEELSDIKENLSELNKATAGNHLKFGVDYRFAVDNLQYEMADGTKAKNDALLTNRLWIDMGWSATNNLSFNAQLAYNKAFGARSGSSNPASNQFETFDWIANENAYDDTLRVRSAYFFYKNRTFLGTSVPWTFSVGRRPSTGGHLSNFREDDKAQSPLAHSINVEFDGLSSKFSFDKWVDGMYIKFCAGRGMSNATTQFSATPFSEDESANPNIDLAGLIFAPYNDGQYSVTTQYYYANNLIDVVSPSDQRQGFETVGGMHSATANFTMHGIGNEWNDFLDDSIFFISAAMSVTDPKANQGMLGSAAGESVTGTSYWIGAQFPSLMSEDGRMGFEYNHGSKYWRSITYGEDTNVGSKVATRGNAYEAYFTEYLIEDILSLQLRYTYIDYEYSGSNGFFGNTSGASSKISSNMANAGSVVDNAQDIRFYLRYKY